MAFIWKQLGTSCINLPQTHDIIRLLRLIIDNFYSDVLIVTETNIPSHENLSYSGIIMKPIVYIFLFTPLLIHAIVSEMEIFKKMVKKHALLHRKKIRI